MVERVTCPACGFKHLRRPDAICPRCSADVLPPQAPAPAPTPATAAEAVPLPGGARLAGAFLVVNAVAVVLEGAMGGVGAWSGSGHAPAAAAIHDLIVGGMLLGGQRKVLRWTVIRVCLGAIVYCALYASQNKFLLLGLQLAFSAALLLLLLGTPARSRIAVAVTAFGAVLIFEGAGLLQMATGRYPLATAVLALRGELRRAPAELTGSKMGWRIRPPAGWYLRTDAAARRDNELCDRWLILPELDAHIMVLSEHVAAVKEVDPDTLARVVLDNARKADPGIRVLEQGTLSSPAGARMLHALRRGDDQEIELLYGIVASGQDAYQVVTFAPRRNFAAARADLETAIASFQPAPR